MGFFDYIMKGMGFEAVDAPEGGKEKAGSKNSSQKVPAKRTFEFPVYQPESESDGSVKISIQPDTEQQEMLGGNVIVYSPKSQSDVKNLVDFLRRKEPIIVNFSFLPSDVASAMIAFMSGALYALKGSIHPIAGDLYLLTPEGVNILVPKEK